MCTADVRVMLHPTDLVRLNRIRNGNLLLTQFSPINRLKLDNCSIMFSVIQCGRPEIIIFLTLI